MYTLNINTSGEGENIVYSKDIKDKIVKFSFYITYAFLMTTATITFIEAIRTKDSKIRDILNLETCISIVAAFFYGMFIKKINVKKINYKDININRYVDWSITTPIMLLVLILAFCYNINKQVTLKSYLIILILNYGMLLFGFLGENKVYDKMKSNIIGFIFFCALYGFIYFNYIHGFNKFDNNILYICFIFLWALYGVAYWLEEEKKNVAYNVLDLFSKCFVGIFFWAYFTKAIILEK
jgi:bacteriorhodopsin